MTKTSSLFMKILFPLYSRVTYSLQWRWIRGYILRVPLMKAPKYGRDITLSSWISVLNLNWMSGWTATNDTPSLLRINLGVNKTAKIPKGENWKKNCLHSPRRDHCRHPVRLDCKTTSGNDIHGKEPKSLFRLKSIAWFLKTRFIIGSKHSFIR